MLIIFDGVYLDSIAKIDIYIECYTIFRILNIDFVNYS